MTTTYIADSVDDVRVIMRHRELKTLHATGWHVIHYCEWTRASDDESTQVDNDSDHDDDDVVICVHGLTRNCRDFDVLARALCSQHGFRVLCPDIVGRGQSGLLDDKSEYGYPLYVRDMAALVARSGVARVHWIGTSMGALIGMMLASMPGTPIRSLTMNDIGPFIPASALTRLSSYVGKGGVFRDVDAFEVYLRETLAPFGTLSDAQWRTLAQHSSWPASKTAHTREAADGDGDDDDGNHSSAVTAAYDAGIACVFDMALNDIDLWHVYDAISSTMPVHTLRGVESDLLSAETATAMSIRGPRAVIREFEGCGHAPSLMVEEQVAAVMAFVVAHNDKH